jgi:hypothetical protein
LCVPCRPPARLWQRSPVSRLHETRDRALPPPNPGRFTVLLATGLAALGAGRRWRWSRD